MLEIEDLAAKLVGVGVDRDEVFGEVPREDGMHDSHSHDADTHHADLVVAPGRRGRSHAAYSFRVSL